MIKEVDFKVLFNKEIPETIPTTPGSFTFVKKDGEEVSFDFEQSMTFAKRREREFACRYLDTVSFPEAADITEEDFINMSCFADIFVDLDEADPETKIEKILYFSIYFDNDICIDIDRNILDIYEEGALRL